MSMHMEEHSESFAKEHVDKWVSAWNSHDVEAVLALYSDDIEFSSPKIKVVFPERKSSTVTNKTDLREYWTKGLKNNFSNLHFTPKQILMSGNVCILEYDATLDGKNRTKVMEKFEFRGDKVAKASAFYGIEEPIL